MAIAVVDLPEPDSPMIVTVSPSVDVEADAVDGAHDAGAGEQLDLQVRDLEDCSCLVSLRASHPVA